MQSAEAIPIINRLRNPIMRHCFVEFTLNEVNVLAMTINNSWLFIETVI